MLGRMISCQYAADPARGIANVARVPRDEMNVHMHARLARGATNVHSNVVTVWRMLRMYKRSRTV